nr:heat stress transcription factor C-1-like [Tanacetum cinerariifolium]
EDPEILPRMMLEKNQRSKRLVDRKRQRMLTPQATVTVTSPSPSGIKEEEFGMFGGWGVSSPEGYYGNEPFWQSSPSSLPDVVSGGGYGYSLEADGRPPPGYPFSLLGGGFSNSF